MKTALLLIDLQNDFAPQAHCRLAREIKPFKSPIRLSPCASYVILALLPVRIGIRLSIGALPLILRHNQGRWAS